MGQFSPFEADADSRFFFESDPHGEALARLVYVAEDSGMGLAVLTGEIGSGKTMLLQTLLGKLPSDTYTILSVLTANFSFEDLLQALLDQATRHPSSRDLSPGLGASKYALIKSFEDYVWHKVHRLGKHLIICLDEAHFLHQDTLEELKCLTNINRIAPKALTIIFSGQPEIKDTLRSLPQFYQRVGLFFHLNFLTCSEIMPFIQFRLKAAGCHQIGLFDKDAVPLIFDVSKGCPRIVVRLCKIAYDRFVSLNLSTIDVDLFDHIK